LVGLETFNTQTVVDISPDRRAPQAQFSAVEE
jgi:hypothetical protein